MALAVALHLETRRPMRDFSFDAHIFKEDDTYVAYVPAWARSTRYYAKRDTSGTAMSGARPNLFPWIA